MRVASVLLYWLTVAVLSHSTHSLFLDRGELLQLNVISHPSRKAWAKIRSYASTYFKITRMVSKLSEPLRAALVLIRSMLKQLAMDIVSRGRYMYIQSWLSWSARSARPPEALPCNASEVSGICRYWDFMNYVYFQLSSLQPILRYHLSTGTGTLMFLHRVWTQGCPIMWVFIVSKQEAASLKQPPSPFSWLQWFWSL